MILVSIGFFFPVSSPKQVAEGCRRKLYIKGSQKLDLIHYGDATSHSKNISQSEVRRCDCFDLYKNLIPYKEAWSWQKTTVKKRHTLIDIDEDHSDTLIILQHPPVYTLGTGSLENFLKFDIKNAPHELYRTERGGEVTYHGPGQLVMYPILNLRCHKMDLHWYLRSLEEVVIRVLLRTFSIKASRIEGLTGVWVGNKKLASVGIRVSRWITYHGLALNVTTDLGPFQHIVPCGIHDCEVGTLSELLLGSVKNEEAAKWNLMDVTHDSLLKEFSEIFQFSLEHKTLTNLSLCLNI